MNAQRDIERRLTDFYSREGALRAPDRVLTSALATIETTPQRRVLSRVPWRFPNMSNFAKMAAAAVAVIAVVAFSLAVFSGGRAPGTGAGQTASPSQPPPSASPSASLPSSPLPTASEGVEAGFRHQFAYTLPAGVGWELLPVDSDSYAEFWVPSSSATHGSAVGVILRAIEGGRVDPCAASSQPLPLSGGPQGVIDYLKTVPRVEITEENTATIDGIPAVQALVETGPASPDCRALRPFAKQARAEEDEIITEAAPEVLIRITAFDIGDDHIIVIWTWAETPEWFAVADELIDSLRF